MNGFGRKTESGKSAKRFGATLIVTVILVAMIVILVGFGRLAWYSNQVKIRLDRQREIQQTLLTRSIVRWLETFPAKTDLPSEAVPFSFPTVRGDVSAVLRPTDPVYPSRISEEDFFDFSSDRHPERRDADRFDYATYTKADDLSGEKKYPFSVEGQNLDKTYYGICLGDRFSSPETAPRLEIDLASSQFDALWTENPFGLRYLVRVVHACEYETGEGEADVLRFALTPYGEAFSAASEETGFAIWFEQTSVSDIMDSESVCSLFVKRPGAPAVRLYDVTTWPDGERGFQLGGSMATFFVKEKETGDSDKIRTTKFFQTVDLSSVLGDDYAKAFGERCEDGVRLTLELDVRRSRAMLSSGESDLAADPSATTVARIAVTPSYEYETELSWSTPTGDRAEVSTVIACNPDSHGGAAQVSAWTYDTHGTYMKRKNQIPGK